MTFSCTNFTKISRTGNHYVPVKTESRQVDGWKSMLNAPLYEDGQNKPHMPLAGKYSMHAVFFR